MGFSGQEYWSRLPFPSPGDLPNAGIKPKSPALQADALPSEPPGKLVQECRRDRCKGTHVGVCLPPSLLAWEAFLVLVSKTARQKSDHTASRALNGFTVWTSKMEMPWLFFCHNNLFLIYEYIIERQRTVAWKRRLQTSSVNITWEVDRMQIFQISLQTCWLEYPGGGTCQSVIQGALQVTVRHTQVWQT